MMTLEQAQARVTSYLGEGAELRLKVAEENTGAIIQAARSMSQCLRAGGKLLFFGNGGSAADAQHLAAEFVGRFAVDRAGLSAIALSANSCVLTAVANDYGFEHVFVRQIEALGRKGDIAIGISTSGKSANVVAGMKQARTQQMKTVALCGNDGGALAEQADIAITIRSAETALVQEVHIAVGHLLCELIEREFSEASAKRPLADITQ